MTGSASGMGKTAADKLRAAGHTVIGVDITDADVTADLSVPEGRRAAAEEVLEAPAGTSTVPSSRPGWDRRQAPAECA